jgi:hypothetical protein
MAEEYLSTLHDSDFFVTQHTMKGYRNTYYTLAALFKGEDYGVPWQNFRKKYIENGGDGIYAAHQLVYNEPCFRENKIGWGRAEIAENLQKNLMLFTTNQKNEQERQTQIIALEKTLSFFK